MIPSHMTSEEGRVLRDAANAALLAVQAQNQ